MDSAALAKLVAYGKAHSFDSLLIARHGRIVLDAYYAPYTAEIPHTANSVTKAVSRAREHSINSRATMPPFDISPLRLVHQPASLSRPIASRDVRRNAARYCSLLTPRGCTKQSLHRPGSSCFR